MSPFLRNPRRRLWRRAKSSAFRLVVVLTLGFALGTIHAVLMSPVIAGASYQIPAKKNKEGPLPWERRPTDLRAAVETNKLALQLTGAVFEARLRRSEVEFKFKPKIAPPDRNDPLSGPNDLAISPLLQDLGQGAVWLSIIMSADRSDLSPRLQQVQQGLLERLQEAHAVDPAAAKKQIRKPNRSKALDGSNTAEDIERILQTERNFQAVVSEIRGAFPTYAELYLHQSPRKLNRPGEPTVFELCDPAVSADPLQKNERMQASLIVKVYRYEEHSFKIVSFWLYRTIEDPQLFVPRALYSEKGRDVTRNSEGRWDETHMPPRNFSSVAYVSQAVTVLTLRFVDGEPVISGRSVPAGRRRAQAVELAGLDLNRLNPATDGVLDVSVPSFPVTVQEIPHMPALALQDQRLGVDYMPRIRGAYEFGTQAEYDAYLTGIREALTAQQQAREIAEARSSRTAQTTLAVDAARQNPLAAATAKPSVMIAPVNVQHLVAIYLDPQKPNGLNELSLLARDSLKQHADLRAVSSRNLADQLVEKSNASLRNQDQTAALLQQKLLKVPEVKVYFLASENTTASWRGPDDATGKGGIVVILPNRYYFDSHQFYSNAAGALINQAITSEEVATVSSYVGGAAARPAVAIKQFPIEIDYVEHGWDENGEMRRWPDEAVDFFKHLKEAVSYLEPRLETMAPNKRATLEKEIPAVEEWLSSLGDQSVTVNFGLYKGKSEAPPPKVDADTRTIWISCTADEYIKSEQKEYRWPLLAKIVEGFNGLEGGRFDPGITGAIYDILTAYATDKDNKLMIAWRLNSDLPGKPANWPVLAGVPGATGGAAQPLQGESRSVPLGSVPPIARGAGPDARESTTQAPAQQLQKPASATAQGQEVPAVAASVKATLASPQLEERRPKALVPTTPPGTRWADPALGEGVSGLISSHMNGVNESSFRGIVLQTMRDRLIIVRDANPNFHSKISSLDLREPSPDQFDFTVNKTAYFDALFSLGEKDKMAYEVIWSTFEENAATVEYAAGNHDFGPFYRTLRSSLSKLEKRHTNGVEVSANIFEDPEFKALLPYYTTFWSNWQFAGEKARFQYLHDRVSSKRLRQLAVEAGKSPETATVQGELQALADQVNLFYGDAIEASNPVQPVESNAGQRANSLDTVAISHEPERESNKGILKPWQIQDFQMTQLLSVLQRVQDPATQRSQYRDDYRRAFMLRLLLDAWMRTGPEKRKKLLAGDWDGEDLRFVLAVLAEIQAKRVGNELDTDAILRLSRDMPWLADPRFDLTQGAFAKFPDTLKPQP